MIYVAASPEAPLQQGEADLEAARAMRVARLVSPAIEHFRERLGEFYRRYPYDEWYPLNPDEFAAYRADKKDDPDIKPFSWQEKKGEKG
jgi:hypothetical protein